MILLFLYTVVVVYINTMMTNFDLNDFYQAVKQSCMDTQNMEKKEKRHLNFKIY